MTLSRRGFLGALLAASAAPAIVKAESLMKLYVPPRLVLHGDGFHDDTRALQALISGHEVYSPGGVLLGAGYLPPGEYKLTDTLVVPRGAVVDGRGAVLRQTSRGKPVLAVRPNVRDVVVVANLTLVAAGPAILSHT